MVNDAISRSAVLEEINEIDISDCTDVDDIISKAYAIVAYAPALDVAPKWISTKDRLPEEAEEVLVVVFGRVFVAWHLKDGRFESGSGMVWNAPGYVEYWMPMPEPPREA